MRIARAEDPYALSEDVVLRARSAARDVYTRWAGDDAWREHYRETRHGAVKT